MYILKFQKVSYFMHNFPKEFFIRAYSTSLKFTESFAKSLYFFVDQLEVFISCRPMRRLHLLLTNEKTLAHDDQEKTPSLVDQ